MSIIDIVLGALLLFGLVRGFMKGLFVEVASLVALIAGVYGAIHFSNFAADFLQNNVEWNKETIHLVAFAITFIGIVVVIALAGKALTKLANLAALGIINKLLGGIFGALKIGLVLSVILIVFDRMNNTIPFTESKDLEGSVLYEPVKSLVPLVFPTILQTETDNETQTESDA
ncbi:CvpA family protein [Snuella lapsa]|uniref:CvpA family protein n=1 Tax=Snuella lapsa TaxID=870481 RepID=A0ABP6X6I5_9FLAO